MFKLIFKKFKLILLISRDTFVFFFYNLIFLWTLQPFPEFNSFPGDVSLSVAFFFFFSDFPTSSSSLAPGIFIIGDCVMKKRTILWGENNYILHRFLMLSAIKQWQDCWPWYGEDEGSFVCSYWNYLTELLINDIKKTNIWSSRCNNKIIWMATSSHNHQ